MSIQETITINLAEVSATDDYRVELRQEKKRTTYTIQQARDLALELIEAAEQVDAAIEEDLAERGLRLAENTIRTENGEVAL